MQGHLTTGTARHHDRGRWSRARARLRSIHRGVATALVVLALAACSDAADPAVTGSTPPPPAASTSSTPVPSPSAPADPAPSASSTHRPTDGESGPPPGPVVTVTPVEPLPDGGVEVRLRAGEPVTVAEGVTVELVALDRAEPGCDDCPNRATLALATPQSASQVDITMGGLMEPSTLEAARRLQVGSWVVRVESFGDDHLDVRVVDLDG